jgi:two-component system KDP operon response regulator KdpE
MVSGHDPRRVDKTRVVVIGTNPQVESDNWGIEGIELEFVPTVGAAIGEVRRQPPDAAIIFGSNASAAEMCTMLRQLGDFVIGVLPESLTEDVAIRCLEGGADFALPHPVGPTEVVARLRAAMRRNARTPSVVETGNVRIDFGRHEITRSGVPVAMTRTEFRLLSALAARIGEIVPAPDLLRSTWGDDFVNEVHYVRLYIGYLRSKLEDDPSHPKLILTRRLEGYQLAVL